MRHIIEVVFVIVMSLGLVSLLNNDQDYTPYNVLVETVIDTPFGPQYMLGSGVVISENGQILTAGHVLKNASRVRVTLHDGRVFDVNDFYVDEEFDVGFVDLPIETTIYSPLSDSNDLPKNVCITHVGNPGGIRTDVVLKGKIEDGSFQRLALGEDVDFLLAILTVEPGCSGGGAWVDGRLIGIVVIQADIFAILVPSNVCQIALGRWSNALP